MAAHLQPVDRMLVALEMHRAAIDLLPPTLAQTDDAEKWKVD